MGIGNWKLSMSWLQQCLIQKLKTMKIDVQGKIHPFVSAKDIALFVIGQIGTAGGTGYAIEFCGDAIHQLSMEGRMTLCNMAIEAGARSGMVAVDDTTINYLKNKPFVPKNEMWDLAEKNGELFT